jgi:hypothetical protein
VPKGEPVQEIPGEEETLAQLGLLLLITQQTEEHFSHLLRVVFKDGIITHEDFFGPDKRTLGGLITDLRKRMEVEEAFDGLLTTFLEQRNLFAHNLVRQEWFDMHTEEGRREVWNFIAAYYWNLEHVYCVCVAYSIKMGEMCGAGDSIYLDKMNESGFLPYLKREFYPRLGAMIKPKNPKG